MSLKNSHFKTKTQHKRNARSVQIAVTTAVLGLNLFFLKAYALDPRYKYEKLESKNFHIIFDAKSYEDAKQYAVQAERSHKILKDVFGISPSYTVVLLEADLDLANGSATGVPRPLIIANLQPPTSLSTVNYFSDWPQDVFLHEYAHVLNMEPATGVFTPLRWIFGSIIRPNMFLPHWYVEGLAVEMESRFNPTGRLKSEDYDAMIRAFVLDGKWGKENISQINETSTPTWPQGQRPYFYGSLLWHEIYQKKGPQAVQRLNNRYGGRFPWFFLSTPLEDEMDGKSYSDLLKDIYEKYQKSALEQIEILKKSNPTVGQKITIEDGIFQHSPVISPDRNKMIFANVDINGDANLYLLTRETGKDPIPNSTSNSSQNEFSFQSPEKLEIKIEGALEKVSWFPNSEKFVYDSSDIYDRVKVYYDLYSYDLKTKHVERLTMGLRAREPSVSPDGQNILFVKGQRGNTALYNLDLNTKKSILVYSPKPGIRISRPSHIDTTRVVFAEKTTSGKEELKILNLVSKQIERTFKNSSEQPLVVPGGIVYTSALSGVENLYFTNFDFSKTYPLTNTLTRVVNGTYDPDSKTVYYADLTGEGVFLKKASAQNATVHLSSIQHPLKKDFPDVTAKIEAEDVNSFKQKNYWPARYMFPQFWVPWVYNTEDGTTTTMSVFGNDATLHHNYLAQALYDSRSKEWSGAMTYAWVNSYGVSTLSVFDTYTYYTSLKRTTNDEGMSLEQTFSIPGLNNDFKGALGFEYEKINIALSSTVDVNHYFKGPFIGFNYSNLEQKLTEIAPAGQNFYIRYTDYLDNNTNTEYQKTMLHMSHYHSAWLPKRHRLVFKATGVYSERNRSILLGTTSSEIPYTFGPVVEGFYLRGYPPGEFIGYSMALGKVEYKFPVADIYSGPDNTAPIFIKRLHGEVFFEALTLNGIYFEKTTDDDLRTNLGKFYLSAGAEGKLDMTLFYYAPVTLVIGGAYGFTKEAQGELRMYTLFQSPILSF